MTSSKVEQCKTCFSSYKLNTGVQTKKLKLLFKIVEGKLEINIKKLPSGHPPERKCSKCFFVVQCPSVKFSFNGKTASPGWVPY